MAFDNAIQFKEVVAKYVVFRGVALRLRPNKPHRVRVTCEKENCNWYILRSLDGNTKDFTIKTYN